MAVKGLDDPCPTCERPSGDHTLREWSECMDTPAVDLPAEEIPDDIRAIQGKFNLPDSAIPADGCIVKAAGIDASTGAVSFQLPALIHEFNITKPGRPPLPVAEVVFLGSTETMRSYARLVGDSAEQAIKAVERG